MRLLDLATAALAAGAPSASAFQLLRPPASHRFNRGGSDPAIFAVESRRRASPALLPVVPSRLSASADDDSEDAGVSVPPDTVSAAKSRVLTLARRLSPLEGVGGGDSRTGVFVTDPDQRRELRKAVAELEAVCGVTGERERQLTVGDWTLLCTTNTPSGRPGGLSSAEKSDKKKTKKKRGLPFKLPENNPAREVQERIRDKVRKSIEVTQRIRTSSSSSSDDDDDDGGVKISRVDNVVEFSPPFETLSDVLTENSPLNALKDLKLNPLEVKKSKVTLIHDANVESTTPVLRTKIGLKSVVLTIAGTSQYLEPDGADILGLNVPLGEFLNAGYFDTTYVDENLRISRGSVGPALDVLRVFVRRGMYVEPIENAEADLVDNAAPDEPEEEKTELQSSAENLRDAVEGAVQDVVDTLNDDLEKVRDSVEAVGSAVEDAAEDLAVAVSDGAVEVGKAAGEVRDAARGRAKDAAEEVRDGVEDAVRELEDQAEEAVAAAVGREDARKMRESVDGAMEDVAEGVKNVTEAVRGAAEDVVDAAEGGAEKVREAAEDATRAVSEDVGEVVKAAEDVAEDVAEAVRSEAEEEEGDDGETEEEGADKEEDEEKK